MNPNSSSASGRPVRLRDRLREATAEAILEAAEQAFATEGPKARMESIAARAGIAVGTLYNHFADREALWAALCRSRREALLVRLDEALERSRDLPFAEALRAFLDAFAVHWTAHRGFLAVLIQAEPVGARSPRAGRDRTMASELASRAAALVRRGVDDGDLRPEGASRYPALLMGMVRGTLFQHLDEAGPPIGADDLVAVVDLFLHGAAPRETRAAGGAAQR